MPTMTKRGKRKVLIGIGLVALMLGWKILKKREPEYAGHRFSEWVLQISPSEETTSLPFQPTPAELRNAILTLSTNNLPLLANWISYDPGKSIFIPIFNVMPLWFNRLSIFDEVAQAEERGNDLAENAVGAFQIIREAGSPAIPELEKILREGSLVSGSRSLNALYFIGEPAIPSIVAAAKLTNCPTRYLAISSLWSFRNNPTAYMFLTNALADPDFRVRDAARDAINGIERY